MDLQYLRDSARTMSSEFHPEVFSPDEALDLLVEFENLARKLDNAKKGLIYGRPPKDKPPLVRTSSRFDKDELHAILGKITEVAELSEVLRRSWESPSITDDHRVADEMGDDWWYDAILLRSRGLDPVKVAAGNVSKLKARFPEKFDAGLAVNRNTDAEEKALSEGLSSS